MNGDLKCSGHWVTSNGDFVSRDDILRDIITVGTLYYKGPYVWGPYSWEKMLGDV